MKAHAWNACIGATLSGVRIPPSPPHTIRKLETRFLAGRFFFLFQGGLAEPSAFHPNRGGFKSWRLFRCLAKPVCAAVTTGSTACRYETETPGGGVVLRNGANDREKFLMTNRPSPHSLARCRTGARTDEENDLIVSDYFAMLAGMNETVPSTAPVRNACRSMSRHRCDWQGTMTWRARRAGFPRKTGMVWAMTFPALRRMTGPD